MLIVRKLLARDQEPLLEAFPQENESQFEDYYIEHLREIRLMFVALDQNDEAQTYLGYANILWEAPSTALWQRSIPEIVDLFVVESARRQGVASRLIQACELAAKQKGLSKLGMSVSKQDTFAPARKLYEKLGFEQLSDSREEVILVKEI